MRCRFQLNELQYLFASAAIIAALAATAQAVTIQTVPVGYAGNSADPGGARLGAVAYNYNIGTFDVTNAQYVEFLDAKAATTDPYGLWNSVMESGADSGFGGIVRSGSSGSYAYTVQTGYANKPVMGSSWFDAVRFVNWMQNGQGNGDTESGSYLITDGGNDSGIVTVPSAAQRQAWATSGSFHWLLPSNDEWYKAAYYDGSNNTYYAFPFQSNSSPAEVAPPGSGNAGNFDYSGNDSDSSASILTDVGQYSSSQSPFGAFDMGGNLFQWVDTAQGGSYGLRGGSFNYSDYFSGASANLGADPADTGSYGEGFRLVSVPEPDSMALLLCGLSGLLLFCMRKN